MNLDELREKSKKERKATGLVADLELGSAAMAFTGFQGKQVGGFAEDHASAYVNLFGHYAGQPEEQAAQADPQQQQDQPQQQAQPPTPTPVPPAQAPQEAAADPRTAAIQAMVDQYLHITVNNSQSEEVSFTAPYNWNVGDMAGGPGFGKNSPGEIQVWVQARINNGTIPAASQTPEGLASFCQANRVGVDCSGFVYNVLNGADQSLGGSGMADITGETVMNASADDLTKTPVGTLVADARQVQPGDTIRFLAPDNTDGPADHVGVVISVEHKDGALHIGAAHSTLAKQDGQTGVRTGTIVIPKDGPFDTASAASWQWPDSIPLARWFEGFFHLNRELGNGEQPQPTPQPTPPQQQGPGPQQALPPLGALSANYESHGGPEVVSTGQGDAGGASYGTYQMTSQPNGGTVGRFVSQSKYRDRFAGQIPGSDTFTATWQAIAAEDPQGFAAEQHEYIKQTHYDPSLQKVQEDVHLNVGQRSNALQQVLWSTAVQHGPNNSIFEQALGGADPASLDDADIIQAVYAERGRRNPDGSLAHFSSSSWDVQQGVAARFVREQADALAMLAQERQGGPPGQLPSTPEPQADQDFNLPDSAQEAQGIFVTQFTNDQYNPTGPNSSANCGPASVAMTLSAAGKMPEGLTPEQRIDHARALMNPGDPGITYINVNGQEVAQLDRDHAYSDTKMVGNAIEDTGGQAQQGKGWEELDKVLIKGRPVVANGYYGASWKAVLQEAGRRAGLEGYAGRGEVGHFISILGRPADDRYIVADPMYTGGPVEMSRAELEVFFTEGVQFTAYAAGT